jgi:hypothetical protein
MRTLRDSGSLAFSRFALPRCAVSQSVPSSRSSVRGGRAACRAWISLPFVVHGAWRQRVHMPALCGVVLVFACLYGALASGFRRGSGSLWLLARGRWAGHARVRRAHTPRVLRARPRRLCGKVQACCCRVGGGRPAGGLGLHCGGPRSSGRGREGQSRDGTWFGAALALSGPVPTPCGACP